MTALPSVEESTSYGSPALPVAGTQLAELVEASWSQKASPELVKARDAERS